MTKPKPSLASGASVYPETLTAQALGHVDETTRAIVPSIHVSSTYERDPDGGFSSGRGYSRPHNPSYDEPEALLTALEGGSDCLLFASGMAAATAVFQCLLPGDHIIAPRVMYWALRKWLVESAMSWGLQVEFINTCDPDALKKAMRPGQTRLVWLETPANPMWEVTDIVTAAEIAHASNAIVAVDSTVATPVLTKPIELGADLVVHSASKYLSGHGDVVAGAVVGAKQDAFWQRLRAWRRDAGAVLGPFEAWLLLRGMRTLFVRVKQSCDSALAIAQHFDGHPCVGQVLYPGLSNHSGHELAVKQMSGGFSGMLSLRHKRGEAAAIATAAHVKVLKRATSLGGVESLIEHRASIEGPSTPVPTDLLRLSIGLEHVDDLIADLERALTSSAKVMSTPLVLEAEVKTRTERDFYAQVELIVGEQIRPLIRERGGEVYVRCATDSKIELELTGSPGAVMPVRGQIRAVLNHYLDNDIEVLFVAPAVGPSALEHATSNNSSTNFADKIQTILTEQINPIVHAHDGRIELAKLENDIAYIEFHGRCRGCALAEVTLRQGVEILLKEAIPELVSIVDITNHTAGTNPFYETKKS